MDHQHHGVAAPTRVLLVEIHGQRRAIGRWIGVFRDLHAFRDAPVEHSEQLKGGSLGAIARGKIAFSSVKDVAPVGVPARWDSGITQRTAPAV
jgi:hypothetical protein